jgi:hypothetical protein
MNESRHASCFGAGRTAPIGACLGAEPSPPPWWLFKTTDGGTRGICDVEQYVDFYDVGGSAMAMALRQLSAAPSDLGAWLALVVSIAGVHLGFQQRGMWAAVSLAEAHAARSLT